MFLTPARNKQMKSYYDDFSHVMNKGCYRHSLEFAFTIPSFAQNAQLIRLCHICAYVK